MRKHTTPEGDVKTAHALLNKLNCFHYRDGTSKRLVVNLYGGVEMLTMVLVGAQARQASLQERRRKQWQAIEASASRHAAMLHASPPVR